ncbi:hypothetical protein Tco_1217449 [Tanacetum coccineum]
MTSFDYRLNPIYAIKECSSCGSLYTSNCGCLKGSLKDKILVPKPPRNCARCAKCGTPIDGPYCQGCALLRKEFMEGLLTNCVENEFFKDFQDTSESSDDNTNVVNAPREPTFVKSGNHRKFLTKGAAGLYTQLTAGEYGSTMMCCGREWGGPERRERVETQGFIALTILHG